MSEQTELMFSHKEVVSALLKSEGIHEGIWMLSLQFGIAAANVGNSDDDLNPAAVVPVIKIGVKRVNVKNSLTVDAAEVSTNM